MNATAKKSDGQEIVITDNTEWEHNQVRAKIIRGHTDAVKSCQFFNDDKNILTASCDKTIVVWDFESGRPVRTYSNGHAGYISEAKSSPDGKSFASCGWDKKILLWDISTGGVQWSHTHEGIVTCCNFSHDGKLIVSGSDLDHTVKVWDAASGQCISQLQDLHSNTITSCMFSPKDDRIITTSMDQTTRFWDLKSQTTTITLKGHTNMITDATISSDEHWLASVSYDKSVQIWDVSTGAYRSKGSESFDKAHEGCISSCDFSSTGAALLLTGGYDNYVCVWDVENHVQNLRLQGHTDWVEDVTFSADAKWIVSCSRDKTIRCWNIENTEHLPMVLENRKAVGLKLHSDNPTLDRKCIQCGKTFSLTQTDSAGKIKQCVFCRLQTPDRNVPTIGL